MKLNHANQVTILRILLIAPFMICMLKSNEPQIGAKMRYVSLIIFVIMALSDAYDGYVARKRKMTTKLGAFLDPMADKMLMTCACILLSVEKTAVVGFKLPAFVVVLIIGKDIFLLLGFLILYFMTFEAKIFPAFIGKLATFLQLSMVIAILIAPEMSKIVPLWLWFLKFLWSSAAATAIIATLIYIRAGSRYIDEKESK